MAQKSNPISLRLKKTNKLWNSCWYGDYNYTQQLLQDRGVEAHIQNICQQAKMAPPVVFLNRQRQQTSTFFFFSRQQRISRRLRPSRGPFQRSARTGLSTRLHKLLFWSLKVPVQAPGAVNNNSPLPANSSKKIPPRFAEKGLHFSPPYFSGSIPPQIPYLLLSQRFAKATPYAAFCSNSDKKQRRSEKPMTSPVQVHLDRREAPSTLHVYPPGEWSVGRQSAHDGETGPQGQPFRALQFILSTWKKERRSGVPAKRRQAADTHPPFHRAAITGAPPYPSLFPLQKTCQQGWGFFAMRNQYSAGAKRFTITAGAPGGRVSRPPTPRYAVPLQSGGLVNVGRNVASPWRNHLESCISAQTHHNSTLHFLLCPSAHQNPLFLAAQLCFSLENRKTFRRLKDRLMQDISADSSIKGVRITCSGRVAARSKKAQKARTESIQWGQTSLNVFSDLVNFASKSALTPFGKIGVKVWICYREIKKKNS